MSFLLAVKAFFHAYKNPEKAKQFVEEKTLLLSEKTENPSHLRLIALLQESGRLVDFLKEDISAYPDEQVGAAVRAMHKACGKLLEDLVTLRPVLDEKEGSVVTVPFGFDPATIKIVGNPAGKPPFQATVVHPGWKAHKRSLPKQVSNLGNQIIAPAEVQVS